MSWARGFKTTCQDCFGCRELVTMNVLQKASARKKQAENSASNDYKWTLYIICTTNFQLTNTSNVRSFWKDSLLLGAHITWVPPSINWSHVSKKKHEAKASFSIRCTVSGIFTTNKESTEDPEDEKLEQVTGLILYKTWAPAIIAAKRGFREIWWFRWF